MVTAKFRVYKFDRAAKSHDLLSVNTEWPDEYQVDVQSVVRSLRILYPSASGVSIDFGM